MTKRLNSKHKVDRRLKLTYGEDQKALSILELMDQANMVNQNKVNLQITEFSYKLSKSLKLTTVTLMKDNLETFIKKLLCLKVIRVKT
jgi:hypothetical protein